jgi:hypothetical protein
VAAAVNGVTFEGRPLEVRLKSEPRQVGSERPAHAGPPPREPVNEEARLYIAHMPAHYAQAGLALFTALFCGWHSSLTLLLCVKTHPS